MKIIAAYRSQIIEVLLMQRVSKERHARIREYAAQVHWRSFLDHKNSIDVMSLRSL